MNKKLTIKNLIGASLPVLAVVPAFAGKHAMGFPGSKADAGLAGKKQEEASKLVPLDSIRLSDPCILADKATRTYYMTGTGGMLWKSKDLKFWEGPKKVTETDSDSWMGPNPMIWAAELHQYNGKYYYFATFTNRDVIIGEVKGNKIERRASHVLVSDKAEGPYRPMADATYLPASCPTLDGPWIQENEPITPPNFGHNMLFQTFDGQWLMSLHSHCVNKKGEYIRVPHLFKVNLDGDKLVVGEEYKP